MGILGKILNPIGKALRLGGKAAGKALKNPAKTLKWGAKGTKVGLDAHDMLSPVGPERQQYTDGSWETDEDIRNRLEHEQERARAQQEREAALEKRLAERDAAEKRKRIADQDAAFNREVALTQDGTEEEIEERDRIRSDMDPDYELTNHRALGISKYQGRLLVAQRLARRDARLKREGKERRLPTSRVVATGMVGATIGIGTLLSQCDDNKPKPVQTVAATTTTAVGASSPTISSDSTTAAPVAVLGATTVVESDSTTGAESGATSSVGSSASTTTAASGATTASISGDSTSSTSGAGATTVVEPDTTSTTAADGATTTTTSGDATSTTSGVTTTTTGGATTDPTTSTSTTTPPITTTSTTTTPTTTTTTTIATTTTTAPVVPLAWAQNYSIRCNSDDEAIVLNASFIVRDSDSGEDLVEYNGSQATLSASGTRGSSGQATASMSGASVAFAVPLSPPATSGELLNLTLRIDGVRITLSANAADVFSNACTY